MRLRLGQHLRLRDSITFRVGATMDLLCLQEEAAGAVAGSVQS